MSAQITIQEAIEAYIQERGTELSDSSIQNHTYQLKQFREWCGSQGIESIEAIQPIHISRFRRSRAQKINSNTMYNQLSVLRLFLDFCGRMQWCQAALSDSIVLPTREGKSRSTTISADRVGNLIDELHKYRYASLDHVILSLLWSCALRVGALRSLDVADMHCDEHWFNIQHRAETSTPLKNKSNSERELNMHVWVSDCVQDYIETNRVDATDKHGRQALLTSRQGRLVRSSIRDRIYRLTDCAGIGKTCDCTQFKCSSSVSPHDIRRASISTWLDEGVDVAKLSDRVDSSKETIEEHYDVRSEREKRKLRRDAFNM